MKKILLISLILITSNLSADDEFPIQLTCEIGHLIMYYNISEDGESTWRQNHVSNIERLDDEGNDWGYGAFDRDLWDYEVYPDKYFLEPFNFNQKKIRSEQHISDKNIRIRFRYKRAKAFRSFIKTDVVYINRITGGARLMSFTKDQQTTQYTGQCTKGLKEYNEKLF
tara:strand:- start:357 stop:860 length:504 start_codon:yes stop_codon:yes gene_type:complete